MTLASVLLGASGGTVKYRSGNLYMANPEGFTTTAVTTTADRDYLVPFSPRESCTVDKVAWNRRNTTAANVYVGLYSAAGTLLTNCAVDTDTTVGWHLVDTTNVAIVRRELYWLVYNESASVGAGQYFQTHPVATSGAADQVRSGYMDLVRDFGFPVDLGTASANSAGVAQIKNRTNAALLSSLTLSGFSGAGTVPTLGVVLA